MNSIIDFFLRLDVHLSELIKSYGTWFYAIMFLVIFCETGLVITPFLPGDSLLFAAGALAAIGDKNIDVHFLVVLLVVAAILGDACNYFIGKYFGRKLFRDPDSRIFKRSYLEKTHTFYERHGGKTIIMARFIPIVRTFAPFIGGMGRMHYPRFFSFNVFGGVLWVTLFTYAGYFFGEMEFVKKNLTLLMLAIVFASVIPAVVEAFRNRLRSFRNE
ncbi:MAG: DedA family protein [Dysgonamonadaceae bacterium]|nr:DedA family protein [Dysgonamonadaceae bacterium]